MVIFGDKKNNHVVCCERCKSYNLFTLSFHKETINIFTALIICNECGHTQRLIYTNPGIYSDSTTGLKEKLEIVKQASVKAIAKSRAVY
jgi:hypothetical protein